uniref:Glycosyltransferase family 92 protein n=2 Tax=Parascaris univalens TaxID=6257 RepID=A0A915CG93_PARUN
MQRRSHVIVVAIFIFISMAFLLLPQVMINVEQRPHLPNRLESNSLIIYRAYVDQRMQWPTIRIIAFSQCRDINSTLRTSTSSAILRAEPVEGSCPWKWAPTCKWVAFMLTANLTQRYPIPKSIFLREGNRQAAIRVHPMPSARSGLHVCVPPLYWYSDYVAIIQFIEIWKLQGASHFYIYYQSISRTVLNVIRTYAKQGIVTIIEWRLVPKSTIDPNRSIYRIGHSLAHNDCLLRSNGRFVALVDIDEFIIANGTDLIPLLTNLLQREPLVGSFIFAHSRLRFYQQNRLIQVNDWRNINFEWLLDTEFELGNGPPKTIFLPDRTEIMLTHSALRHLTPFIQLTVADSAARLYHARNTWSSSDVPGDFITVRIFHKENVALIRRNYFTIMSALSPFDDDNLSNATNVIARLVTRCLSKWKEEGCKTPFHSCRKLLINEANWILSDDTLSTSPYIIL